MANMCEKVIIMHEGAQNGLESAESAENAGLKRKYFGDFFAGLVKGAIFADEPD